MSGRIAGAFASARGAGRAARIAFICCGDPDPSLTVPICEALVRAGIDLLELGVPWSDPLADGPVIQRAALRAIGGGTGLARSLDLAAEVRRRVEVPLALFTYYNPVHRMGEKAFAARAASAGIDGVLVTDLPLEEGGALRALLTDRKIDPILLVAPTSGPERVRAIVREARGFVYCIARTGVTGQREALAGGLEEEVARVRRAGSLPVAVGFGLSTPDQIREAGSWADGVVVGSALVSALEGALDRKEDVAQAVGSAAARIFGT